MLRAFANCDDRFRDISSTGDYIIDSLFQAKLLLYAFNCAFLQFFFLTSWQRFIHHHNATLLLGIIWLIRLPLSGFNESAVQPAG